jgi:ribonuclease HI
MNKAPGPDGIRAVMLKNLPEAVIEFLAAVYKNCLVTGKIPDLWLNSKVIFIPKSNKTNMEDPRSYRPICLSNFLFKTLEKLIQHRLENCKVYPFKLSKNQHGFRPNCSTLTALSEFTNEVERAFSNNQKAIAVFLDIQGAFDNMNPFKALDTLYSWGAQKEIINMLKFYYQNRSVTATAQDQEITMYPTIGSAQGNVLSPMLWNCVFDQVAHILSKYHIKIILFADDSTLIITGHNLDMMTATLQRALNCLQNWMDSQNLQVNVAKSCTICFSRNKMNHPNPILFWNGLAVPNKTETTYLGVLLNSSLSWSPHLHAVTNKAKTKMITINQALGKVWGPSPKLTHWIYTGIIRPMVSYAAHIWCGSLPNHSLDKISRSLQRWALTKLGPCREKTPTAGLEIVTHTIPLHIYLQEMALKTMNRFNNIEFQLNPARNGHWIRWQKLLKEYIPLATTPSDFTRKVCRPDFTKLLSSTPNPDIPAQHHVNIYTDGSSKNNFAGSGFLIKWGKETRVGMAHNGTWYSVFLSELRAIKLAVQHYLSENTDNTQVNIFSDSKSAIDAIRGIHSSSHMVQSCWDVLQSLDQKTQWTLNWIKGHAGNQGNSTADLLAKQATSQTSMGPSPLLPIPSNIIKKQIKKFSISNWRQYWTGRPDCRQTKLWFPEPNQKHSKDLLNLSRDEFGLLSRWITGHCYLARHQSLIHFNNPECNLCQLGEETPWHLLRECPNSKVYYELPQDNWSIAELRNAVNSLSFLEVQDYLDF